MHYSTCLVWISCITGSNWTYTVLYITCTGKYTYPPGQQMYCQEFYYPAGLYYTTGLAKPVLDGYIKKKNLRHSPQSSTCSHTENLNLKNQITTDSGVPNAAKIIKWCQGCQGLQVVIDERDQGILSKWTLVVCEWIPRLHIL